MCRIVSIGLTASTSLPRSGEASLDFTIRRFHDLRHTAAATLLMAGNVHPRIVAELLGHTDTRTTLELYSHVSTAMQREASQQLHEIVEKAKAGGVKR
jgi:integrase